MRPGMCWKRQFLRPRRRDRTGVCAGIGVIALLTAGLVAAAPAPAETYTILDLGTYGGNENEVGTIPNAINAAGQVAGMSQNNGFATGHAFLDDLSGLHDIGQLGEFSHFSQAYGINNAGQIVGYSQFGSSFSHAWLYADGVMRDLGTLGGGSSTAYAINSAGHVVGYAQITNPFADNDYDRSQGRMHAFLYDGREMRDLGTLGGTDSSAYAINDADQVVGSALIAAPASHAFLWEAGAMRDLGTLGGNNSSAWAINNAGQIIGQASLPGEGASHAFLYDSAGMHDLGTLGGVQSSAKSINASGQIVGWSLTEGKKFESLRPFLYQDGHMIDLNSLLPPGSGWALTSANAINDAGQIVGEGTVKGQRRGFLMTPGVDARAVPPRAPSDLSVHQASNAQLDLSWTDNSSNEMWFQMQLKRHGDWVFIGDVPVNTTRFSHTGLKAFEDYTYRVRAINIAGASAWSNEVEADTGVRPRIDLSPPAIDFGAPRVGTSASQTIDISNPGNGPLTLGAIRLEGEHAAEYAIVSPERSGATLAPGDHVTVEIRYSPASPHESEDTRLLISSDDPDPSSPRSVLLRGGGTGPAVTVLPGGLDFGAQSVGVGSGSQVLLIQNTGNEPLDIAGVSLTGANKDDFRITADGATGTHLLPGRIGTVSVRFTPGAMGSRGASLAITDSALGSPQLVPLAGTGVAASVGMTPDHLSFGEQLVGATSAEQSVSITNIGTAPLTIFGVSFTGEGASDFALLTDIGGFTLGPGSTGTITLRFKPTAAGLRSANLSISDSAPGTPHLVALSGTGTAPRVRLGISRLEGPRELEFERQPLGTTSGTQSVTLSNTGTAPLSINGVKLDGTNAVEFAIASDTGEATLAPGASRTLTLRFTPGAAGLRGASLVFSDSAPGSPHALVLRGTGVIPAPGAPTDLSVRQVAPGALQLTWADHSATETGFGVWRKSGSGGWERILDAPVNATSFTDRSAQPGTAYTYRVRAHDSLLASEWSNEVVVATPPVPAPPSALVVHARKTGEAELTWSDNSTNETAFAVWRKGEHGEWERVAVLAPDRTSFVDRGTRSGGNYQYRVRAIGLSGASDWTAEVEVEVPGDPSVPPAAPTGLTASRSGVGQVELTWQDNSGNETAFAIWRKGGSGGWSRVAVVPPNRARCVDSGLQPGVVYTYRVRATNNSGASGWTGEVEVHPAPPAAPGGLTTRAVSRGRVELSWSDRSADETAFEVWRRGRSGGWAPVAVLPPNGARYTDTGAAPGASYTYRVRAIGRDGASEWTNEVEVMTAP
jgi:probable HAF family extracellular repeat protein